MQKISFTVPGDPRGKGRPRFAKIGAFMKSYQPKETVQWENWVKLCFTQAAMKAGFKCIEKDIPVRVVMLCYFQYPKSMSLKKQASKIFVTKKPDCDNILKTMDALNGIAWHDDSQVVYCECTKKYTLAESQIEISIEAL